MKIPGVEQAAKRVCTGLLVEPTEEDILFAANTIIEQTKADLMVELCEKLLAAARQESHGKQPCDICNLAREIQAALRRKGNDGFSILNLEEDPA